MNALDASVVLIANWLTIIAGLIAILGLMSAFLSRPRPEVNVRRDRHNVMISLGNSRGGRPVKDVAVSQSIFDTEAHPLRGDGHIPLASALHRGEVVWVELHDPAQCHHSDAPRTGQMRLDLRPGEIAVVPVTWQSGILPWLRSGRVIIARSDRKPKIRRWIRARGAYSRVYSMNPAEPAEGSLRRLLEVDSPVRGRVRRRGARPR